ncbi:SDR family oxidoreductase [Polaribacter tangerinus]|uniref:SDR family oxidoreductase n=1 Tax=Polaribacter tangerinus TaxID=1920034 RepID=UPI000B4B43DD|nr:SDR family oxidoreductase [Polaribacter tangerinus]
MKHKYVLITGGALGIGAGIVKEILKMGYSPIVLDVVEPENTEGILFFKVDLSNQIETRKVLDKVTSKFKILRLINNVGIVLPSPIEDTSFEDFNKVISLNTWVATLCLQSLLPAMKNANFGRVVSITSRTILGKELRTAYSGSKGALSAMSKTWSLELASKGITVNTIAPGPIETDAFKKNNPPESSKTKEIINAIPVKRIGTPADIGNAVNFFLDDNCSFITGQTLFVCGGLTVGLSSN